MLAEGSSLSPRPDFPEFVHEHIFVKGIRADRVPLHLHLHEHRIAGLEEIEIVHEVRVIFIFLPPVAHLFSEFFLIRGLQRPVFCRRSFFTG